jgi:hypothetical protein
VVNDDDIWSRLLALAETVPSMGARRLLNRSPLTLATELVADLGLIGDDAFEFMEAYAEAFGVERGDYRASDYFDAEELWILPGRGRRPPKQVLTLGMLLVAARAGVWRGDALARARDAGDYAAR